MKTKYQNLQHKIKAMEKVFIAFSGGVDSTFLLLTAVEVLGPENVTPGTAVSEFLKEGELSEAEEMAASLGTSLEIVRMSLLDDRIIAGNPTDRCYHCKKKIFSRFVELAAERDIHHILEGSNADDVNDYRPGMKAVQELGVESPLLEVDLTKAEIRSLLNASGQKAGKKPSSACLASRIPYNTPITQAALQRIEKAEDILLNLGFSDIRVREHDTIARIETRKPDISDLIRKLTSDEIITSLKSLGYMYITVDPEGYRTGSLNEKVLADG